MGVSEAGVRAVRAVKSSLFLAFVFAVSVEVVKAVVQLEAVGALVVTA